MLYTLSRTALIFNTPEEVITAEKHLSMNMVFYHESGSTCSALIVPNEFHNKSIAVLGEAGFKFKTVCLVACERLYKLSFEEIVAILNEISDNPDAFVLEEAPGIICYNDIAVKQSHTLAKRLRFT